ncbi:UDP-N-acetylglucosamine 1-carboxyvinyltransferase [bacterium]|nr:MAG: UDP-N-acetylglucosamine 1-carboxyvinyltransferase [bacterium]
MDQFIIQGGKPLKGTVTISGAKNAILPAIAAAILASDGITILKNIPNLNDIRVMLQLLNALGIKTDFDVKKETITIDAQKVSSTIAPYEIVKKIRASFLVLGPLLARFKNAQVSLPGGCAIGVRGVDIHLNALQKLGAEISDGDGYIKAVAKKITGTEFYFNIPTHTGTENIMMAACMAEGTTTLINAAREPEVSALADMLNSMGAKISGAETSVIKIEGVRKLHGTEWTAPPSRIETCFFIASAAITRGEILIKNANTENIGIVQNKMSQIGINIQIIDSSTIRVKCKYRVNSVDFTTWPYPGFMTDFQAQMMALLATAKGTSIIKETVFENRFMHVSELNRMNADIHATYDQAIVVGVNKLVGANVMASDLQGGASLVLAGLVADGKTIVDRVYHIDRGYESMEKKLKKLGANIKRFNPVKE